ncbi:MAG: sugar isomerase [Phycisphaerae bacterium]|nr:sugar isomerase [Phycisphaerae bacterium]
MSRLPLPVGITEDDLAAHLDAFSIETPSWGYADTGTRFGKFLQDAAATTIEEKFADAGHVHRLTGCCPSVAVHVRWDFPFTPEGALAGDVASLAASARAAAAAHGVRIGSINPNLFEDQCYKLGSVCNEDPDVRRRALDHLLTSVRLGAAAGSDLLSLWFADGTNYPGQGHLRRRAAWMREALARTHAAMPPRMSMLVEYKPFEPAFYHTDIADWGMAASFARAAGPRARVLVDTGHHLPGCNIEHLVAFLLDEGLLGGFHFNDRKYADDDLTMGSIDPYQLFRIFAEITSFRRERPAAPPVAYMIDQSHNIKPKVEAMIQTVATAQEHVLKSLLIDHAAADRARARGDVVMAEKAWRDAFAADVRPWLAEYRVRRGLPADPLRAHRDDGYEARAAAARGPKKRHAGRPGGYA